MRLYQLQEARYHGLRTKEEVYDMYQELEQEVQSGEVQVLDVENYGDIVLASLRVWTHDVVERQVRDTIKEFLDKHNLPYSHIAEIAQLHKGDWRATVVYGDDK